ncbi:MAG: S41 family peptidase, partial [Anaeromyxobacteraceae bacterium]
AVALTLSLGASLAVALTLACGGGEPKTTGKFAASSTLAGKCAAPRPGTRDARGSLDDEKAWLRSWNDELYLWYREVPQTVLDAPGAYATPVEYFAALKTPAQVGGKPKDQFHFFLPTDVWNQLSQSGIQAGYGVQWALLGTTPPRRAVVAYVESPSQAQTAGIRRGLEVVTVDGVDLVNDATQAGVNILNEGLFPTQLNEQHVIVLKDPTTPATVTATLTAQNVTFAPVHTVKTVGTGADTVGYILFNDHVATAEGALVNAVHTVQGAGAKDLVLDLRYNGGGLLGIASEVAYMIAGPARTTGKTFEKTIFSDKYPTNDPVTGDPLVASPFQPTVIGYDPSITRGQALPHLDLPRVYVLTTAGTCSASESIINSLQGIGVEVIQVGGTTCGKPYGFYPQDNCGTTYFSIQFQGVNAAGFGDYANGFTPGGTGGASPHGCGVSDDFGHELGDPAEAQLAAALAYRATGQCPQAVAAVARRLSSTAADVVAVPKGPWRENRILVRP